MSTEGKGEATTTTASPTIPLHRQ
ncbi:unnamed protein product, partial [Rotaria magnacalcarata]